MLFVHPQPGFYAYWMRSVRFPLDVIWMNPAKRIVGIVRNAQPCLGIRCPRYLPLGVTASAQYVLEIAAGASANLQVGQTIQW